MAKNINNKKDDELLRRIFFGSSSLTKRNEEFAYKMLRLAWRSGMPKTKTIGAGEEEAEVETDIFDAIKFVQGRYAILKEGSKLNSSLDKVRKEIDALPITEKVKKTSSKNPYSVPMRNIYSMPWTTKRHIEKKYGEELGRFRDILNSPEIPVGLHQEPLVGPTQEGATGYEFHETQERIRKEDERRSELRHRGESNLAYHRANRRHAWWYDHLSEDEKLEYDLTERYGGGAEGRRMARQKIQEDRNEKAADIRKERRSRDRRAQNIGQRNFNYDMMDEFDQKMHDLTERYGGDAGKADASLRNMLKKELGPFFKNSRMSTRDLHSLVSGKKIIGRIPIIGQMMTNPAALGITAVANLWRSMFGSIGDQFAASRRVVERMNKFGFYGKPSDRNMAALMASGESMSSTGQTVGTAVAKLSAMKYGRGLESIADLAIFSQGDPRLSALIQAMVSGNYTQSRKIAYDIASTLPDGERINFLGAAGISEKEYNAEKIKHGGKMTRQEEFTLVKEEVDAWADDFKSQSTWKALSWGIANGIARFITIGGSGINDFLAIWNTGNEKTAEQIAQSDIAYQQSRAANPSYYDYVTNNNGGSPVSIHIDTAEFNGIENLDGLKNEVSAEANTVKERHATVEAYDPKMR